MKISLIPLILLGCLFQQGCLSLFPDSESKPTQCFLERSKVQPQTSSAPLGSLKIERPKLAEWLDSERLFLKSGFQIEPLADLELIERSGDHIYEHLLMGLKESQLFKTVGTSAEAFEATHILSSHVHQFWIEKHGSHFQVHFQLSTKLIATSNQGLKSQSDHRCSYPLNQWSRVEIIQGFEKVLTHCLQDLTSHLKNREES